MSKPTRRPRNWTFAEASKTLLYIRFSLGQLRENFILVWHLYKKNKYKTEGGEYGDEIAKSADAGRGLIAEFNRIGVIAYQSPLRGIALFPFLVHAGKDRRRESYFVYKDSREEIETFIFKDDLCTHNDLYGYERLIPAAWKETGAIPTLTEGNTP